jgi:hypothetical protein
MSGLNLTETLSLTEKLQRAEERALAAEMAIANALTHWLRLPEANDCSPLVHILKAPDLAAAREVMRRAEEHESLQSRIEELESGYLEDAEEFERDCWKAMRSLLAECNWNWSDDPEVTAEDAREHISITLSEVEKEAATLRAARDELAALVERKHELLQEFAEFDGEDLSLRGFPERLMEEARDLTPTTALAELKARWKREGLEEAAKHLHNCEMDVEAITELRRMAEVTNA